MADIYVKSGGGVIGSGSYRGNWTASQTYVAGDRVCGVAVNDYWIFECTTGGTANTVEPTWVKTAGSTTTDNTAIWTARIPDNWTNATFTLAKAAANDVAGDNIYVSQSHAESSTVGQTITLAGTAANPTKIICVNDSATPPTSTATTAVMTTTGASSITITGSAYIYGITFNCGTGASAASLSFGSGVDQCHLTVEYCVLNLLAGSTGSRIYVGTTSSNGIEGTANFLNCQFKFTNTSQKLDVGRSGGKIRMGSIGSGSVTPLGVFAAVDTAMYQIIDFDFSNFASTLSLVISSVPASGRLNFINCKMPANWSGNMSAVAPINPMWRASLYNSDSISTNYILWVDTYAGSIKSEIAIIRNYGATNGTTPISWKLVTNANANEYVAPLITDDMAIWVDSIGSVKKITVDILHDSATALTDAEIWLEIDYLGSSATPLGTPLSDKRATVLTTAANQPTSTASWTTTGLTTPNKQKLEVTFTPQMKGFVYARVCLAKPSYTVYVDPQAILS